MKATLCDGIDWVGHVDWIVRDFHGYDTELGATYNAYLIRDEKVALIDTVKAPFAEDLLAHIAALTTPDKIDYVICNHAEPDHASAMPVIMAALPNATVVCNSKCRLALGRHFDTSDWRFHEVTTGDRLPLGKRSLQFINTPMVHWPESMFTYVPEEKILFSMDAFGQHYASSQRFDDEVDLPTVMEEARAYYANIVMPYGQRVKKVLTAAAGLDIEMIAPSHGIIWRSHIDKIIAAYHDWASYKPKPKVLIIYDTMWNSTGEMAKAILEGATQPGVETHLLHIRHTSLTRLVTEVLDAAAIAFGSPTLNTGMMPMAAAALTYLKGLRPSNKAGFSFGSYGWSRGGPEAINDVLEQMRWEITHEPVKAQFRPTPEILERCRLAGMDLARRATLMSKGYSATESTNQVGDDNV
ncbi:MAG: FprA family A-type flavoprotein [bacterium]|nr:FprA family A-type flavoprotein [bacterium]